MVERVVPGRHDVDEVDAGQPVPSPASPSGAGEALRRAREAQGLGLADVATRTRVPLRHLEAIELGDYAGLPSPTYAVGFARSYARAVGGDEVAVAAQVRADIDRLGARQPEYVPYEAADPARVPSRGVTIAALGVALAVLVLAGLYYGTTLFRGGDGGSVSQLVAGAVAPPTAPAAAPSPAAPVGGRVSFVANDEVWLRVYDADGRTLRLGTMKPGDRYDVPADAKGPMINVGRPDKLAVTLDGRAVPPLGTGEHAIKDVKVDAASIAARLSGQPAVASAPAAVTPTAAPAGEARPREGAIGRSGSQTTAKPRAGLTETQRANLDAAASPPPAGNAAAP